MKIINGGVTAPKGFTAVGIYAGLKKNPNKKDMALIYSECICECAGVYTSNKVKGEPLKITMEHLEDGKAQAVIINSGNANTCTGIEGLENARKMTKLTAEGLNIKEKDVIVASTGVIGMQLDMGKIENGIKDIVNKPTKQGYITAREAIMTTDTVKKDISIEIEIDGKKVVIGAMAKGSGMIHPNMCTMLSFITTDINIDASLLKQSLKESADISYNRISIDGDTSTNDMVVILANGMAENEKIVEKDSNYKLFKDALDFLNTEMAKKVAADGEGATKLIETKVIGAKTKEEAANISKTVTASSLVKTAMFGSDANWGRILCAIGYSGEEIDPDKVDISFESGKGYIDVCEKGVPLDFSEETAKKILGEHDITIWIDLHEGQEEATTWGCDLSYEYVRINGDYRS
ncbi:MAG: bifunctional glutamate N-acetyltransferase/amino-acid acetyltransferase ArgJ [Clostridiaceae bacterium]